MYKPKLIPCFFCNCTTIKEVGHHNWRCSVCGATGPDEDIHGEEWNKMQTLLWKSEGINPAEF